MNAQTEPVYTPQDFIAEYKLRMKAEFIPFSQSRNRKEKSPSLNWRVTILRDGREVLTTDYGAGYGHCPAYKAAVPNSINGSAVYKRQIKEQAIALECETGKPSKYGFSGDVYVMTGRPTILPSLPDVLYSLVVDASVLDHSSFEDWASDFGYDTDSRAAEKIYRACLEIALKLRAALGEAGLQAAQRAFQDY